MHAHVRTAGDVEVALMKSIIRDLPDTLRLRTTGRNNILNIWKIGVFRGETFVPTSDPAAASPLNVCVLVCVINIRFLFPLLCFLCEH